MKDDVMARARDQAQRTENSRMLCAWYKFHREHGFPVSEVDEKEAHTRLATNRRRLRRATLKALEFVEAPQDDARPPEATGEDRYAL